MGDHRVRLVARLDQEPRLDVGLRIGERLLHHPLDLGLRKPVGRPHLDRRGFPGPELLRLGLQDPVGVDEECDLDLRHPRRHRVDPGELEAREGAAVLGELALALDHVQVDDGLPVHRRREHLARARRDRRIAWDQHAHDAAERLDPERQRRHVEEQHARDPARQDMRLDRGAEGDDLVGIELAVRGLAEQVLDAASKERHPRRAADQDDFVDVGGNQAGVRERHPARPQRRIDELPDQPLQLDARDLAVVGEPVERNRQRRPLLCRQADLGRLGGQA